ncbi:glycoside hydrolase family 3 protein [Annulohypoxylon maeteangense]|uniref:glycoside hydrolase family 3 protein n=1 Tax=Annulohypoxylon maeteangense TaxID=1927788 RepID=UPI0020072D5A|nr:glycoside hydrolase family 3 protein [Annulohypoxylon maeteangense]KAI0888472.1 glycoside hydrolase family 3 protein [Annulohypoxylon maeteangense]
MRSLILFLASFVTITRALSDNGNAPLYKDSSAPVEDRVADLLSRMTIEEKTAQLVQGDLRNWFDIKNGNVNQTGLEWNMKSRAGSFYVGLAMPWETLSDGVKIGQDYLMQNTTLGIPAWVQSEGIHGFLIPNATIFNSPIAHACSFNPSLVEKMAQAIAQEARALGVNQIFGPLADLARELRFGRVEETFGEDGYLTGELAHAYVKGLQSGNVSAMVKHFAAFATPEQGLNTGPVHGGERELRTTYLPPFKRAIIDGGAFSIMSAYHSYDGVPAVADKHTMTDILRGEWGYKYFVMSDAGATDRLCKNFKMCKSNPIDSEVIVNLALPAGNDVEMGGGSFNFEKIPEMVESGKLSIDIVDQAVSRQLRAKFEIGLFENPFTGVAAEDQAKYIHTPETIELARQLDTESIVLLENRNNILPLKKDANIAVIGPMAHGYMNYGDYIPHPAQTFGTTPLDGITAASSGKVTYAQGCTRWSTSQSDFPTAITTAQEADIAIVVVGTWTRDQDELWAGLNATTGEHVDISSLALVGAQAPLVKAIIATGTPTIVVYSSGKPVTEPWISSSAAAVIQQFYGSEQGGNALADVLFGDANPSGKLSVSIPRDVGTTPVYYDYLNSGRTGGGSDAGAVDEDGTMVFGHAYVLDSPMPLYEFGFGKSYSTFRYAGVRLDRREVGSGDVVRVEVDVTNESERDGAEVVQVYVEDVVASVVVPNKQLRGFSKVFVKAGATETVSVDINVADLGLWDINMKYVVEPGDFVIHVGSSSKDIRGNATLTVV